MQGKRECFLLYSTCGYYFTAKRSLKDFGSADLGECRIYCDNHPEEAKRAIELLYFIRVSVCNYLKRKEFGDPKTILLAQLHPEAFFGSDVFELLFTALVKEPIFNSSQIVNPFTLVAIDEIQVTLEGDAVHYLSSSSQKRPFFSPLVHYSKHMKKFPHFLLCGTGINFQFVKEAMESGTMKRNMVTSFKVVSDFHPLSKSQVESYASQFLKEQQVGKADEIVSRISAFELCHGRPRFVAFILDGYMESRDIDFSISEFVAGITNVDGQINPLRFFKRDLDNNTISLKRTISGSTLGDTISDGLLSLVLRGKLSIGNPLWIRFGGVTDHMCGPDIIYKCVNTQTLYIVQVKFVEGISKQEAANACDTTDPEIFYCKRKGSEVLKGFEKNQSQLRESLTLLQRDGYSLQRMLFIHTGVNQTFSTQGALVVTKSSHPDFFRKVSEMSDIWEFLDSVRRRFH